MREQPVYDWTGIEDESEDPVQTVPVEDDALVHLTTAADLLEGLDSVVLGWSNIRLGRYLYQLRALRKRIAQAESFVERTLGDAMTSNLFRAGDLLVERRQGRDRREWKHDALASEIVKRAVVDRATGHVPSEAEAWLAWKVRDALVNAARLEWRVGALRTQGIDPDDYALTSDGRKSVVVMAAGEEPDEAEVEG